MRGLAVALAVALVASACGGATGSTTTTTTSAATTVADVSSPDGRLTLHVEGPGADSASVTPVPLDAVDFGEGVETIGAFDLGPSGTSWATPASMTFDTGDPYDPEHPAPIASVLVSDDLQTWEALTPVAVTVVDGTVVISADIPHFSRVVINRSDYGMYLDPDFVDTTVGAIWEAYFDLYDRRFVPITNDPVRFGRLYRDGYDEVAAAFGAGSRGLVSELSDDVEMIANTISTGVVEPLEGNDWISTYDYLPEAGALGALELARPYVEVFYGTHDFTCVDAGQGTFGISVDVIVHRSDLVFGAQLATGRLVLVVPSDGVQLSYRIDAPAFCRRGYGAIVALLSTYFLVRTLAIQSLIGNAFDDSMNDPIYSKSGTPAGVYSPKIDLWDVIGLRTRLSRLRADFQFNYSEFECGTTVDIPRLGGPVTTVCPDGVAEMPEGDLVVIAAQYSDLLPTAGDQNTYTYAAVFESNGDPSDDFRYQGGYDWDFFRDTDRWYHIDWDPARQQWSMSVTNGLKPGGTTGARALLIGDTIVWVIPAGEFPSADPTYRVTSFIHDGTYRPEVSAGDVSGADPTEPLLHLVQVEG